jgi:hypothetical protein
MVDRVNKGHTLKTGRPRVSAPTPITSNLAQLCYSWIENDFVAINAEDCPVGRQYSKVIGLFRTRDVYDKYIKSFELTSEHSAGLLPLSLKRFRTILKYHFDKNRVCIRKKKNVTGKCESMYRDMNCICHVSHFIVLACNALDIQYQRASTREQLDHWKEARRVHMEDIGVYRGYYQADMQRSRSDSSFVCIAIDGSDQATTYCPQLWTSHLHKDMPDQSYVEQKVMAVIVHGSPDQTIFYVLDQRVKSGMDVTVNCLLDALTHQTDLRATTLRIQFDGNY